MKNFEDKILEDFDENFTCLSEWLPNLNNKGDYLPGILYSPNDIKQFLLSALSRQREEEEQKWTTAVMYNVDTETWDRIREAKHALDNPNKANNK